MKFSIIVATYNRKKLLMRCVRSVLGQTHEDLELLVVDDGSTDGTEDTIRTILDDNRVKYIKLKENQGATTARNKGLDAATGDFVMIWDSDDVLYPSALERLCLFLEENPDADMVSASTDFLLSGQKIDYPRKNTCKLSYSDWLCGVRPVDAEIIPIRRERIGSTRFRSRNLDYMFYGDLAAHCNMYYLNETLGGVFMESDELSLTKQRRIPNLELSIERSKELVKYLRMHGNAYKKNCPTKYAAYAYGTSVGLLLEGEVKSSRRFAAESVKYRPTSLRYIIFLLFNYLPKAGHVLTRLFKR